MFLYACSCIPACLPSCGWTVIESWALIALEDSNDVQRDSIANRKTAGKETAAPIDIRDWMTAEETAAAIGCSVATVHRLRRGIIPGVPMLPAVPVGSRKFIFRKASIRQWQDQAEKSAQA